MKIILIFSILFKFLPLIHLYAIIALAMKNTV